MSSFIQKQALYYPISIAAFDAAPSSDDMCNIGNITDAYIAIQLPSTVVDSIQNLSVYLQVYSQSQVRITTDIDPNLSISMMRTGQVPVFISADGTCRLYTQPDAVLVSSNTKLRLNACCVHLYTNPATLQLASAEPALTPQQPTQIQDALRALSFASQGYNTEISYSQSTLKLSVQAGLGLGRHPIARSIYTQDMLGAADLMLLTTPRRGLLSINGYSGQVYIRSGASVVVDVAKTDTDTIKLTIMQREAGDAQNS